MHLSHYTPQQINSPDYNLQLNSPENNRFIELTQAIVKKNFYSNINYYNKFLINPLKKLETFTLGDLMLLLSLIQLICYKTNSSNSKIKLFFTDDPLGYSLVFLFIQFIYSNNFRQKTKQNNIEKIQLKKIYQQYIEFIKFCNFKALGKSTFLKYLNNLYEDQFNTKKTLDGLQIEFYDQLTYELKQNYMIYNKVYNQYMDNTKC